MTTPGERERQLLAMLDELLDLDDGLSDWEVQFLESLDRQRASGWTARQAEKLAQIYVEKLG